jgi:hypothetical protein
LLEKINFPTPVIVTAPSITWTAFALSTLASRVRVPFKSWMSVYFYSVFVLSCVQ